MTNTLQTNLTILDRPRLRFLTRHIRYVGVSFDPFCNDRVDAKGRIVNERVLANMDILKDEGIPFGCITVLNRKNYQIIDRIFTFFNAAGISFRLLPYYRSFAVKADAEYALSGDEVFAAFKRVFDLWLRNDTGIVIQPVCD